MIIVDILLAASWDEAVAVADQHPTCHVMAVEAASTVHGLKVRDCYITQAAAAHREGPRAIDYLRRCMRTTSGDGKLVYLAT